MRNWRVYIYLLLLTFASCKADLRELCLDHNHSANVSVAFDWQQAPQMNPQGMTVLFYNQQQPGAEPERYDFTGSEGGNARLLAAPYQAVAYNYDTETILYRSDGTPTSLEAYTRQSSIEEGTQMAIATRGYDMPRAPGSEDEIVVLEPDPLCGAISSPFQLGTGDTQAITLTPQMRTEEVVITIHHVPNLQYTSQFGGAVSGLAPSVYMASGKAGTGRVTQAFTGYAAGDSTVVMRFRIFGHCPDADLGIHVPHLLTVYAILADGSKWYHTQDVSAQMDEVTITPIEEKVVNIEIEELPIPKPIVNGSGFQPTIDGWQGIEIEVGM